MEHKATRGLQVKDAGNQWTIEGYASTWGDPPDFQNDVLEQGAFRDSIASRKTKLLYQHAEPIGGEISLHEDHRGLFGRWFVSKTDLGARVRQLALDGVLDGLSIGFQVTDSEQRRDGVRVLKRVNLLEVSIVTFGANPNALITGAKAARGRGHKGLNLSVELELARRRLTSQGILMNEGPYGLKLEMIRRRIALRQRGIVPPRAGQSRRGR